jgi:hypothetical protein
MPTMTDVRKQAVAGLVPPQVSEAIIRVAWPSVTAFSGVASLGRILTHTYVLAPLGWLLMAPLYFKKVLPFIGTRYTLTNKRLLIQRGHRLRGPEVSLDAIEDVRLVTDANSAFFRSATLEIISKGQVVLTLPGVPGPEAFRHAILNAAKAWGPVLAAKGNGVAPPAPPAPA